MSRTLVAPLLLVLLATGACTDDGHNPPLSGTTTGGAGGGGGGDGDGDGDGEGDAGAGIPVSGNVCIVVDFRFPADCAQVSHAGIVVSTATGESAVTTNDGSFTLDVALPGATSLIVGTSASDLRTSAITFTVGSNGRSNLLIPVADASAWAALVDATVLEEPDLTGAVAVYAIENDEPAVGVEVIAPSQSRFSPFYDDGAALSWTQVGLTGAAGAALLFGVPTVDNDATLTVIGPGGAPVFDLTVPVAVGATTFVFTDVTQ